MQCTILQNQGSLSILYGIVPDATAEYITFAEIDDEDVDTIKELQHNVQSELNRILKKYVNVL